MAFKILQEGKGLKEVYQGSCNYCKCEFEFNKEDIQYEFYDQREGYNVIFLECPHCKRSVGLAERIVRYE